MALDLNKNKVTTLKDITIEISDETGIPIKELEEMFSLSLNYIKEKTKDPNTLSILIPGLGTMYYSERFGDFYIERLKNYKDQKPSKQRDKKEFTHSLLMKRRDIIKKQELENNVKSFHKRKPLLYKFKNLFKKIKGYIVKRGATLNQEELWTEFSEMQNNIQNGKEN